MLIPQAIFKLEGGRGISAAPALRQSSRFVGLLISPQDKGGAWGGVLGSGCRVSEGSEQGVVETRSGGADKVLMVWMEGGGRRLDGTFRTEPTTNLVKQLDL